MKNHPDHRGSCLAKICGYASFSSHWFRFSRGSLCLSSHSFTLNASLLFLFFWTLLWAQPCQRPDLGRLLTFRLLITFWHFLWACFLYPSAFSWLYLEDCGAESVFFIVCLCSSILISLQGFLLFLSLTLILKQGTRGALNGTIQSPRLIRWINLYRIRGCRMEAETFHLSKSF